VFFFVCGYSFKGICQSAFWNLSAVKQVANCQLLIANCLLAFGTCVPISRFGSPKPSLRGTRSFASPNVMAWSAFSIFFVYYFLFVVYCFLFVVYGLVAPTSCGMVCLTKVVTPRNEESRFAQSHALVSVFDFFCLWFFLFVVILCLWFVVVFCLWFSIFYLFGNLPIACCPLLIANYQLPNYQITQLPNYPMTIYHLPNYNLPNYKITNYQLPITIYEITHYQITNYQLLNYQITHY